MRAVFSYILILCVLSNIFSKVLTISVFYYNQDYIAKNICINRFETIPVCNGSCYLVSQLKKTEPKETESKSTNSFNGKIIETLVYSCEEFIYTFSNTLIIPIEKGIFKFVDTTLSTFLFSIFHPPKAQ